MLKIEKDFSATTAPISLSEEKIRLSKHVSSFQGCEHKIKIIISLAHGTLYLKTHLLYGSYF